MKKHYILALAFLFLLMGQSGYAQDWQDMDFDAQTTAILQQFENAGVQIDAFTSTEAYISSVNNDTNPNNNFSDYNGDGIVNTADMGTLIAISDALLNATLALTTQLHEVVVINDYHKPNPFVYYNLDYTNPDVTDDFCVYYPLYCNLIVPPTEDAFIITDSNNPNRTVKNGQTLVMVNSGSAREASIDMTTSFGGDLTWSGTGVTGNGSSATYSGTTSTSVIVSVSGGPSATGNIQIVPESKISYASKIQSIGTKINDVSDSFRSFVEAKGSTVSEGTRSCSLTGTIESKNVDMYADGTKYGNATSIDLNGTFSMAMPKVKIPIYTAPAVSVFATLDLGSATASLNVNGSLDDSTSAKVDLEGGFELGFTAASGAISATLGNADHFCAEATGTVSVGYFKVGGKVEGNSNATGLLLTPVVKVGNIKADFSVTALINIGTYQEECKLYEGEYEIWPAHDFPYSPIILYQKQ